jgi:hypothetical protein
MEPSFYNERPERHLPLDGFLRNPADRSSGVTGLCKAVHTPPGISLKWRRVADTNPSRYRKKASHVDHRRISGK